MKTIVLFVLLFSFQASANVAAQTVNLTLKNTSLSTALEQISKQTKFDFSYNDEILTHAKPVSIILRNETLEKSLQQLFAGQPFTYEVNDRIIIIKKKTTSSLGKLLLPVTEAQQSIRGRVTNENGESVSDVNVQFKGTTRGTKTNEQGLYDIETQKNNNTLVFSHVSYNTEEVSITGRQEINVVLKMQDANLDEVVVVGYGTQKRSNVTGAVATIDNTIFENRPTGNAVQALQGAVPGLRITTNDAGGQLDAEQTIRVRGDKGGIGIGSDAPLILIDGMEGSLTNINPQDIESISVLKDAAAAAIYGSRAANGVVLVTTKTGRTGRSAISYNNNFRLNTPIAMPQMANSWEYVNFINDANFNGTGATRFNEEHLQRIYDYMNGINPLDPTQPFDPNLTNIPDPAGTNRWFGNSWANEDWLNAYYTDWSNSQEHNLSVNGGSEKTSYYVSTNYQGQGGFLRYGDDNRQRYTLTGKASTQATDFLKLDFTSRFSRVDYDKPARLTNTFFEEILRRSIPYTPVISPDGLNKGGFIPILEEGGRTKTQHDDLSLQLSAILTPVKDLVITANMQARLQNNWAHSHWLPVFSNYANDPDRTYLNNLSERAAYPFAVNSLGEPVGSVQESPARYTHLTPQVYANYTYTIGKHTIAPMVGMQVETYNRRNVSALRYNLISHDTPTLDATTSRLIDDIALGGLYDGWANVGVFSRINYNYDDLYLLELNGRYDGSSRFRRGNMRWVETPAVSAGWNISNENFFNPLTRYISYLKVRGSYGWLANQNTSNFYPTYQDMNFGAGNGIWLINGQQPNTASAPSLVSALLTWEKTKTVNFGVDFGLFNNRLSGSFDLYRKQFIDLMGAGIELPAALGTNPPSVNNTDVENRGWEFEFSWRDKIKDFSYSIALNLSDDYTRVLKYPNPTGSIDRHIEGQLTGNIFGYTTIDIAKTHDEMMDHLISLRDTRDALGLDRIGADGLGGQPDGGLGRGLTAGDIMYMDVNGDGRISEGDRTIHDMGDLSIIGNTRPRYHTSARIDLDWRGFDLSMFFQGVLKRDWYPDPNNDTGVSSGQDLNMIFWGATRGEYSFRRCSRIIWTISGQMKTILWDKI